MQLIIIYMTQKIILGVALLIQARN